MRSMLNLVLFSIGSTIAFEIQVSNNCHEPLWPAITGTNFSVHDKLFAKGLRLDYGNSTSIQLHPTPKWSGRIWARSRCDHSGAFCALGSCNNQASCWNSSASDTTLVELTLDKDILDYDISLVDAYTHPVSITVVNGSQECLPKSCTTSPFALTGSGGCKKTICPVTNLFSVPGCRSDCSLYRSPQSCCTYPYNVSTTCNPLTNVQCNPGERGFMKVAFCPSRNVSEAEVSG